MQAPPLKNAILFTYMQQAPDRIDYAELCFESWRIWAEKHNVDIVLMDTPGRDVKEMKPTWQRWHVFDMLENMFPDSIPYSKVALVDLDTLIHPDAPDFFKDVTDSQSIGVVQDDLMVEWIQNSIKGYQDFFPDIELSWTNYFNCGFVVLPVSTVVKKFTRAVTSFYYANEQELRIRQHTTLRKGSDQTPVNYISEKAAVYKKFLDKRWNFTHLHIRGALSEQGFKVIRELAYVYHFNGFEKTERARIMQAVWNVLRS